MTGIRRIRPRPDRDPVVASIRSDRISSAGEYTDSRRNIASNQVPLTSGLLRLQSFTALSTRTVTSIRSWSAAAAATNIGIGKMAVWEVDASGNCGNLKVTANDTTSWNGLNKVQTNAFTSTWTLRAGARYAWAPLYVTSGGGTPPQLIASAQRYYLGFGTPLLELPWIMAGVAGQTDIPSTIAVGSLSTLTGGDYTPLALLL